MTYNGWYAIKNKETKPNQRLKCHKIQVTNQPYQVNVIRYLVKDAEYQLKIKRYTR